MSDSGVLDRIEKVADVLGCEAEACDRLGRLSPTSEEALRSTG